MNTATPPPSFGFLLSDTARLLRRRFDQKVRALGLTRAQWQVLAHLARNEGTNQASLADLIEVEPITLGRTLDRMEQGGWVERRADPNDRRARRLFMTDKARPILARMRGLADEIYAVALAGLSDEARMQVLSGLEHVRANLSNRNADADADADATAPSRPCPGKTTK